MVEETPKLYPFDICFHCMKNRDKSGYMNLYGDGVYSMSSIDISIPSFIFIPNCKEWSNISKKHGGVWGPKSSCDYRLEQTVVTKKKYVIASPHDLKDVLNGVDEGRCIITFNNNVFKIYIFHKSKTLYDLECHHLINIYRRRIWYTEKLFEAEDGKEGADAASEKQQKRNNFMRESTKFLENMSKEDLIKLIQESSIKDYYIMKRMLRIKNPFTIEKYNKMKAKKENKNVVS